MQTIATGTLERGPSREMGRDEHPFRQGRGGHNNTLSTPHMRQSTMAPSLPGRRLQPGPRMSLAERQSQWVVQNAWVLFWAPTTRTLWEPLADLVALVPDLGVINMA